MNVMARNLSRLLSAVITVCGMLHASPACASDGSGTGRLSVTGSGGEFIVRVDSVTIGQTPIRDAIIDTGRHLLTCIPTTRRWTDLAIVETLFVVADTGIERNVYLRRMMQISSEPAGADIVAGDSLIGVTPLFIEHVPGGATLRLSKEGYTAATIVPGMVSDQFHVVLIPDGTDPGSAMTAPALAAGESSMSSIYITTAATVVAGVSAAYFKIKADGYYSDYLRSGDQSAVDNVRRYDVAAGISLAVSQIGMGVLTYLLLSR